MTGNYPIGRHLARRHASRDERDRFRLRDRGDGVHHPGMRVIATSNNPVRLSFLTALLADAGIETILLDTHASVMDGSISAIPRRLCVATTDHDRARRILREAGEP